MSPPPPLSRRARRLALTGIMLLLVLVGGLVLLVDFQLKSRAQRMAQSGGKALAQVPILDGHIGAREYSYHYHDEQIRMDLYWKIVQDRIYLALKSPAHGWEAISLAPIGPQMLGGDILIGYVEGDKVHVRDDFASLPTNHFSDIKLGGTNDILAAAGSESEQGTIIELERKLTTLDANDRPIGPTDLPVQLAYASEKDFSSYHDQNRASLLINFFTGRVSQVKSP